MMDLTAIGNKIFEHDLDTYDGECFYNKFFENDFKSEDTETEYKTNKTKFLRRKAEQMKNFCSSLHLEENNSVKEDVRYGRLGNPVVQFGYERSFGVMSISQSGMSITAASRFATISAMCGVFAGTWMYEVHLGSNEIMQIGWCTNKCSFNNDRGCGDTFTSYAFDGYRCTAWNMLARPYGELWKIGDVIGVCIDLIQCTIEYYRNGRPLGIAFTNVPVGRELTYFPCLSLAENQTVYVNFGERPFRYNVDKYQPLIARPNTKVRESELVLKWMKNLLDLTYPSEPQILNCSPENNITDRQFWARLYSAICYHLSSTMYDTYCTLNNLLPFLCELGEFHSKDKGKSLDKMLKFLDECWMNIHIKFIKTCFSNIFHHLLLSFKQVSESLSSSKHLDILAIFQMLLSHEDTRKHFIRNFLFDTTDVFVLLNHRPFDQTVFEEYIPDIWWDTKGFIPEVEEKKSSFFEAFSKIETYYNTMEEEQCNLVKIILTNTDGNDGAASRAWFLKKLRKHFWRELELYRNEASSNVPTSGAYAFFLRIAVVIEELWRSEMGDEPLIMPPNIFYDHTLKYNCDRIGGLEPYLYRQMRSQISLPGNVTDSSTITPRDSASMPILEMRGIRTINEFINILRDGDESDTFSLPNGPITRTLFGPFFNFTEEEPQAGNMDNKNSILELFEDLIIFLTSTGSKHCRKISKSSKLLEQSALDYNILLLKYRNLEANRRADDPLLLALKNTLMLQKIDLEKRARKSGWIKHVLLNFNKYNRFIRTFDSLLASVIKAEETGELFAFLPDFYFEACYILTDILARNFASIKPVSASSECESLLYRMADFAIHIFNDKRIKNTDSKRFPVNIMAIMVSSERTMNILNCMETESAKELVRKLLTPYNDRIWTATNWVLVRFWQGNGFGFHSTCLPHYSTIADTSKSYVMHNTECNPSEFYQQIVREYLLDRNEAISTVLDSMISELHWIFGEFLASAQEIQRALEKNEVMILTSRHFKACSTSFDRTLALLRVFDMFLTIAPEIFLESYYIESTSFTRRLVQIVLLIVSRIASQQGCFRIVVNARIAIMENVEFYPIESACIAILLDVLSAELEHYTEDTVSVTPFCRMVLTDPNYDFSSLSALVGAPGQRNDSIASLYDYDNIMQEPELQAASKLIHVLTKFTPMLSKLKLIPDEEICTICYASPFDVKFQPCGHTSCLSCVSYHIKKSRLCFFCKQVIQKVMDIGTEQFIPELEDRSASTER